MVNDAPNFIAILLSYLDPSSIFSLGYDVAENILPLSALLLTLAILFRTVNEQFNAVSAATINWSKLLMDVFLWGTLLVFYFFLSIPVIKFFNLLYAWSSANGSLEAITLQVADTVEKLNAMPKSKDGVSFSTLLDNSLGYLTYGGAWLAYLVSFILTLSVAGFFKMGHAFLFSLSYIWGLVAIPLGIVNQFKLIKPWATFTAIILIWPIFEAFLMFFFKGIFLGATSTMMRNMGSYSVGVEATFYVAFSILNFLIMATIIAAPFVAQNFISGSGLTATIASFAGAGLAAGMNTLGAFRQTAGIASKTVDTFRKSSGNTTFEATMKDLNRYLNHINHSPPGGGGPGGGGGRGHGSANAGTNGHENGHENSHTHSNSTAHSTVSNSAAASSSTVSSDGSARATSTDASADIARSDSQSANNTAGTSIQSGDAASQQGRKNQTAGKSRGAVKASGGGEGDGDGAPESEPKVASDNTVAADIEKAAQKKRAAQKARQGHFINKSLKKKRAGQ